MSNQCSRWLQEKRYQFKSLSVLDVRSDYDSTLNGGPGLFSHRVQKLTVPFLFNQPCDYVFIFVFLFTIYSSTLKRRG